MSCSHHTRCRIRQCLQLIHRRGEEEQSLKSHSTPGVEGTLTDLLGKSDERSQDEKSPEGRIRQRTKSLKNIGMFKGKRSTLTQHMERGQNKPTTRLKVVCQKD
ncbi:hypothetical protein CsSME_00041771 [Camellia sinensis var. sinensis]